MRISDWSSDVCSSDLCKESIDGGESKAEMALPPSGFPSSALSSCSGLTRASRATVPSPALGPRIKPEGDSWNVAMRSEERREGKEGVSTGRYRWAPYNKKKKKQKTNIIENTIT